MPARDSAPRPPRYRGGRQGGQGRSMASSKHSDKQVRQQLDRVLSSATFQPVDRLKRFVRFVVQETLAGRSDQLKEYTVGVQVFGKTASFDPRTDPIVRVQARRLRARLARYYHDEGGADAIVIELPKGGYSPIFKHREGEPQPRQATTISLASRNTVAVLPFVDHTHDGDLGYFCSGLRREIIHGVTRLGTLRVLAWNLEDARHGGNPREDLARLGAGLVIDGGVRRAGAQLRITTQIIDGDSGCYRGSESVDASADDVLGAQAEVTKVVVKQVEAAVLETGAAGGSGRRTENLAAHNLYLQGRYHLNQRTEGALQKAEEFFQRAIAEDPHLAVAHSGLADAYSLLAHYAVVWPAEVWAKTASSAATAVMLDGNSAEARTSLAHVKATQDWDWSGAREEYLRALALDPRYSTAHHWYAMSYLVPMGRLDEAREEILLAQSLDPISSIIAREVASIHYYRGEYDAALDHCDQAIELNPFFSPVYWMLALIQEQRGDLDEATAALRRAAHLSPHSPRIQSALARVLALADKRKMAMKVLGRLQALAKTRYVSPFEFASIQFALGHTDAGFQWLAKACQDRSFELISINVDPRWEALKSDRRFTSVTRKVGLE